MLSLSLVIRNGIDNRLDLSRRKVYTYNIPTNEGLK
jgi:hypothetical protein